jgi:hypothetical protein
MFRFDVPTYAARWMADQAAGKHYSTIAEGLADVSHRRSEGARWLVATWFTPELDQWFTPFLPAAFSRQPSLQSQPVDGRTIVEPLMQRYTTAAVGGNYVVLRLDDPP